jgi:hypothetical protein
MRMRLFLDSNIFIAGGNIYGRMEITSATSRSLMLGEISVELIGYEGKYALYHPTTDCADHRIL